jgi:hypothetical protein
MKELKDILYPEYGVTSGSTWQDHVSDLNEAVRELQSEVEQQKREWRVLEAYNVKQLNEGMPERFLSGKPTLADLIAAGILEEPRYSVAELRAKALEWSKEQKNGYWQTVDHLFLDWLEQEGNTE